MAKTKIRNKGGSSKEATLTLSDGRWTSAGDWARFQRVLTASALRNEPRANGAARAGTLWLVVDRRAPGAPRGLAPTLRSARKLRAGGWKLRSAVLGADGATLREVLRECAPGDYLMFMEPGDQLFPDAVRILAPYLSGTPELVLFDLVLGEDGKTCPMLLHGADYVHGLSADYFMSRFCIAADVLAGMSAGALGGARYELARVVFAKEARDGQVRSCHVPVPLMQLRLSYDEFAARRESVRSGARVRSVPVAQEPCVSVIICTKNKGYLLQQLTRSLARHPLLKEIVIVSNQTTSPHAKAVLRNLSATGAAKVIHYDGAFNFSRQCNLGVAKSSGEYLLFLNDDTTPINERWLDELIEPFRRFRRTAITGALLLYPDERVQHAGIFLGHNNCGGHTLRHQGFEDDDAGFLLAAPRRVSAVTGAAMMISRDAFFALQGFDANLAGFLQDIDICLRAITSGWDVIFNPRSVLLHMESASVKEELSWGRAGMRRREQDFARFYGRWGDALPGDPFHHPHLALEDESLRTFIAPRGQDRARLKRL